MSTAPNEVFNSGSDLAILVARGYWGIVVKEVRRLFRIWQQVFVPPIVTTLLYFLVFGRIVGSQIQPIDGLPFMAYIIPGLAIMSAINAAYSNVAHAFFSAKFSRAIEEVLISPIPLWAMYAALATASLVRAFITIVLVLLCARFFYPFPMLHVFWALLVFVLTVLCFTALGFLNALFAKSFDAVSFIPTFIITPLSYLGGVFYSVERLPEPFRTLSFFNPVHSMVSSFRAAFYLEGMSGLFWPLWVLLALAVVPSCVVLWMLNRGIGIRK